MKKLFLLFISIIYITGCSSSGSSSNSQPAEFSGKTTVLLYIDGTSFEQPYRANIFFEEFLKGNTSDALGFTPANYMIHKMMQNVDSSHTNIIVQTASSEDNMKWTDKQIAAQGADVNKYYVKDWDKVQRWKITNGKFELLDDTLGTICKGSVSSNCLQMNSHDMVADFLEYGVKNNPADRYIVIFFSHGGGSVGGFGSPDITAVDMKQAFETATNKLKTDSSLNFNKFDIIGFAACLMGNIEWMYNLSDYGKYYVASEEMEYAFPWLLGDIITSISQRKSTLNVTNTIVDSYWQHSAKNGELATNISVIDLDKVKDVNDGINRLAKSILNNYNQSQLQTLNNFYVSLNRSQRYGDVIAHGGIIYQSSLYDIYDFLTNLDEKLWYNQDYSAEIINLKNLIKDDLNNAAVINNKTSDILADSHGISFFAVTPNSYYVTAYKDSVGTFGADYINLLEQMYNKLSSTTANGTPSNLTTSGSIMSGTIDTNIALTHLATLDASKQINGETRVGTVAGKYKVEAKSSSTSDHLVYTVSVDTGSTIKDDAKLFAINKTGMQDYNPVKVSFTSGMDKSDAPLFGYTPLKVIRGDQTYGDQTYNVMAIFAFDPQLLEVQIVSFKEALTPTLPGQGFVFKKGDRVQIPEATTQVTGKAEANQLPAYEFTCDSEDCVSMSVQSFTSGDPLTFTLNVKNIKGETVTFTEAAN